MPDTKHLEFINGTISRLAGNSFQLKGWNVALATAAIGFAAAKDSRSALVVLGTIPALAFWSLDAYYLALENLYRELYEKTIDSPSFSLNAGTMRLQRWIRAALRPSVIGLHLPMVGVILTVSLMGIFR